MNLEDQHSVNCGCCDSTDVDGILNYGTLEEISKRQSCPFCRLVRQLLPLESPSTLNNSVPYPRCNVRPSKDKIFYRVDYPKNRIRGIILPSKDHADGILPDSANLPGLKYNQLRAWISGCETHHETQSHALRHQNPLDIILIDAVDNRLVNSSSGTRYIALSYVWGGTPSFQTTKANRSTLEQKWQLLQEKSRVPQLIQDAMLLVLKLGERYLWVDTLCIVQDDFQHKWSQISQMDTIYS